MRSVEDVYAATKASCVLVLLTKGVLNDAFFARCLLACRDWAQKTQQYLNNKESSDISQINNYLSREPGLFEKDA